MDIYEQIKAYRPCNEQEEQDRKELLKWLESGLDIWSRDCRAAHLTASAWIVSPDRTKVLMAYHKLYRSWSWLGGHADGDHDLLHVAEKEVSEESGLAEFRPVSKDIYSLEILTVDGHVKKGVYVPSHLHLNVTYLIEADPVLPVRPKEDENKAVQWFEKDAAVSASSEPWFREHIYSKLNRKLTLLQQ